MPYSLDLRKRVVQFVEQGGSVSKAARLFQINASTIYRWFGRENLEPTQTQRRKRKLDWEALRKDVEQDPDTKLVDRAKKYGVRVHAIWYALKEMGMTRKKKI
jgi:transposase